MIRTALPLLAVLGFGAPARAQQDTSPGVPRPPQDGWGQSYWGYIPPPADSLIAATRERPVPLWEAALVRPYRVVTFPLTLVGDGIGVGVEFVDDKRLVPKLADLLTPVPGPFGLELEANVGGLRGVGVGVTGEYRGLLGDGSQARLRAGSSSNGHHLVNAGVAIRSGDRGRVEAAAGYRMRPNARYFGIGPEASEGDESFYRHEAGWAGLSYHRALAGEGGAGTADGAAGAGGGRLEAHVEALFTTVGAWAPRDEDDPPLAARFADAIPSGFGDYSSGVSLGLGLTHDDEDQSGRPVGGGARHVRAWYFSGTDGTGASFWSYRAEAEQIIPLWYRYHVLALRGVLSWIEPRGSIPVPFQRLRTNDHPDVLRGHDDFRWRDRGMTVVSAEYRWPLWVNERAEAAGLDVYLLGDVGQVFGDFDEIGGSNLTASWGVGVRVGSVRGFAARLEVARSEEGAQVRLSTEQVFQFRRRGLYHGREPIPHR